MSINPQNPFKDLPDEIFSEIVNQLPPDDQLRMAQVCKRFRELASEQVYLNIPRLASGEKIYSNVLKEIERIEKVDRSFMAKIFTKDPKPGQIVELARARMQIIEDYKRNPPKTLQESRNRFIAGLEIVRELSEIAKHLPEGSLQKEVENDLEELVGTNGIFVRGDLYKLAATPVLVGMTTLKGQPVEVYAAFKATSMGIDLPRLENEIIFKIGEMGYITLQRRWKFLKELYHFTGENIGLEIQKEMKQSNELADRHLYIEEMTHTEIRGKDGDREVIRKLFQLAVEVLHREGEPYLILNRVHDLCEVAAMAGFKVSEAPEFNQTNDASIRAAVLEARESGRIFPEFKQYAFFDMKLQNDLSTPVSFTLDNQEETWADIIKREPILQGEGPIFPDFLMSDFKAHEKK